MQLAATSPTAPALQLAHLAPAQKEELKTAVLSFLDTIATATARSTYYNTKEQQQEAVAKVHTTLFALERNVYGGALLLPGITDFARQTGIRIFLTNNNGRQAELLHEVQERELLKRLVQDLPPHRALNLFLQLKEQRVNNARTRKLVLQTVLNSPKLELWSVKYRQKLQQVLVHAWSKRMAGILRNILAKEAAARDAKEQAILKAQVAKHLSPAASADAVYACLSFVLGSKTEPALPLHRAFAAAKTDLQQGRQLPYEVLDGIRSTYHRSTPNKVVLELTKHGLSKSQKLMFQRKAEQQQVKVEMNPLDYDATRLYIYAYERGLTPAVEAALCAKAQKVAKDLGISFGRIGILIDNSASMQGSDTQRLHPIAVALATSDVLAACSETTEIRYTQAKGAATNKTLVSCQGSTTLAEQLIGLLQQEPEVVFIISDGYENTASGKLHDVLGVLRQMGIQTPIMHINPVMAAEAGSARKLSPELPVFPLAKPEALGIGLVKTMIGLDVEKGINLLFQKGVPLLSN